MPRETDGCTWVTWWDVRGDVPILPPAVLACVRRTPITRVGVGMQDGELVLLCDSPDVLRGLGASYPELHVRRTVYGADEVISIRFPPLKYDFDKDGEPID